MGTATVFGAGSLPCALLTGETRRPTSNHVELRLGPALDTLRVTPVDAVIDLAFIDADKDGYVAYHEELPDR